MNMRKNDVKVCLTTELFNSYNNLNTTVVVVDLLRATSVISTAFHYGIESIIPVMTLDEALSYKNKPKHIIAAERNTLLIDGFEFGNSPFHYIDKNLKGKTLALTTTNGTKAIHMAKTNKLITASFVNIDAVVEFLVKDNKDVVILCSGWKGLYNLEDTVFAGALSEKLISSKFFSSNCDSLTSSIQLYLNGKDNLYKYLENSSYRKRNSTKEVLKDTKFCLNPTFKSDAVPIFIKGKLKKAIF